MTGRGGRVPVVVRGRESRSHGEGEQVSVGLQAKEKQLADANYRADKAWLLDIQHKLYTWHRGRSIPTMRWTLESPVHNERCTPGLGTREMETAGGNPGTASSPYVHL